VVSGEEGECHSDWKLGLTVGGILDFRVLKGHGVNGVVTATTHTSDGQSMPTRANTTAEGDALMNPLALGAPGKQS
jgi:hypothetical protein